MSKKIKKIIGTVAPIAAPFILGPAGLGLTGGMLTAGSAAAGALGGALSGGGLKGALLGGATGGLAGGGANSIVGSLSPSLQAAGGGLNAAGKGLSGALTGSVAGLASGAGLKGALLGGAIGGAGGYAMGGGLNGINDFLGNTAGTPLAGGLQGPTQGSGVLGAFSRGTSALGNLVAGGTNPTAGGGPSSYSALSPILSSGMDVYAQNKAADDLEKQQLAALGYITPIMNERFNPGDLEQTPGYQFNLSQGQQALDRAASARGSYFSGQALTDAAKYSQGLAQQTYQDAYNNWLGDRSQRLGAAGAAAGITQGIGETRATNALNTGQTLAQGASALLGSLGGGNIYNPKTGTYYDPSAQQGGMSDDAISMLLKQLGRA